jgi:hypothetical protein
MGTQGKGKPSTPGFYLPEIFRAAFSGTLQPFRELPHVSTCGMENVTTRKFWAGKIWELLSWTAADSRRSPLVSPDPPARPVAR